MVNEKIVILIPTLNEALHIEAMIQSLIEGDPLAQSALIIVADGGSCDDTCAIVSKLVDEHPNIRLLHNAGKTQAAAMNILLGPDYGQYTIAVRCDAHAKYPPNFVTQCAASLTSRDVASVVVTMDAIATCDAGCFQQGLAWIADSRLGAGGSPHRGGSSSGFVDHGHHAAFRLDTFRSLRGYDRSFIANEDAEFDRRLTVAGHRIWLDATIRIGYYPRANAKALWRQYFRYGSGRAATCLKHRIRPNPRQMVPFAHVILFMLGIAVLPFTLVGMIWPVASGVLLICVSVWVATRHRSYCGFVAGFALAIMHTAWGLGFGWGLIKSVPQERIGAAI